MAAKTVYIPKKVITSIVFGLIITMVFFYLNHLYGDWDMSFVKEKIDPFKTVTHYVGFNNVCSFESHYVASISEDLGTAIDKQIGINNMKLQASLENMFEGHSVYIFLSIIILSAVIHLFRSVKFKISDS